MSQSPALTIALSGPDPEGQSLGAMASTASAAWFSSQGACRGYSICGWLLAPGNSRAWLWSHHGQGRDPCP